MNQSSGISAILCKTTWDIAAKGSHIGAEKWLPTDAVETGEAGLHWVSNYPSANGEMGDVAAEGDDGAGCFVT